MRFGQKMDTLAISSGVVANPLFSRRNGAHPVFRGVGRKNNSVSVFSSATKNILNIFFAMMFVFCVGTAGAAQGGPAPAEQSLSADGALNPSESDRCPVCAMFPARYPQTAAAMTLASGETFYFCTNGCLLRSWLRPGIYLGKTRDSIDRLVVLDYFSGAPINGRKATWVAGSDVVGPMGPAIIALGDASQLATFKARHGGRHVFTFDQLDDDLWRRISNHALPAKVPTQKWHMCHF